MQRNTARVRSALNRLSSRLNHLPIWRREVSVWGSKLRASSADRAFYLWLNKIGAMGKADLRLLQVVLQPGMTVVDVGANIGCYSMLFARCVGAQGRVYAFEPNPLLFRQLSANVAANAASQVLTSSVALGSTPGRARLLVSALNSGDNFLADAAGGRGDARESVEVEVDTFDRRMAGVSVDFVKIDVQGAEMAVLMGMAQAFRSRPDMLLYIEIHAESILAAGAQPMDLLGYVASHGLTFYREVNGQWQAVDDLIGFAGYCLQHPKYYTNLLAAREGNPHLARLPGAVSGK